VKIALNIAQNLLKMQEGTTIQSSKMKQALVEKMIEDGAIQVQQLSKSKRIYAVQNPENLTNYLSTEFGISNLNDYVTQFNNPNLTRSEAVKIASDSKIKKTRTFKGFLINCYDPINAIINNQETVLHPTEGTFTFISDFGNFTIPKRITIIGIENPENFRHIQKQKYLFQNIKPLFVSRYPQNQSKDFIQWINNIPNNYLHYGDFDFSGISIFLNEYQKNIGNKATFFIPDEIEKMIKENGNFDNYNTQIYREPDTNKINDEKLLNLIKIIHKHKKGLEQEYLINANFDVSS
jgi:hypothetical protein